MSSSEEDNLLYNDINDYDNSDDDDAYYYYHHLHEYGDSPSNSDYSSRRRAYIPISPCIPNSFLRSETSARDLLLTSTNSSTRFPAGLSNPRKAARSLTSASMEQDYLTKSIVHMFLTKKTPLSEEEDLEGIEEYLLSHVVKSLSNSMGTENSECEELPIAPVLAMLEKWDRINPKSNQQNIEEFAARLAELQTGNTILIYIRKQNCTMMISKIKENDEEKVRIQTFRSSLPSEAIMSNVNPVTMNFPETSEIIENVDMLQSKIFVSHLYELALEDFELSMKTNKKGNNIFLNTRDVAQPFLVSDFLVGILVPREDTRKVTISKKIRDQVVLVSKGARSAIPFRRSGMWMSLKVALHLKILEVLEDIDLAKLTYKIVMLYILTHACKIYEQRKPKFDLDLASQMAAKIGRRVQKLETLTPGKGKDEQDLAKAELMKKNVLTYTLNVVTTFHETMQNIWNEVAVPKTANPDDGSINRSQEDFTKDMIHLIPHLDGINNHVRQLIKKRSTTEGKKKNTSPATVADNLLKEKQERYQSFKEIVSGFQKIGSFPLNLNHHGNKDKLKVWLYDTEKLIKAISNEHKNLDSQEILDLAQIYIAIAKNFYKGNPIGFSQMLLVILKFAKMLDEIATQKFPLVNSYQPKVNSSNFDFLLLPYESDVTLLDDLLDYFASRDANGKRPVLERGVYHNSLSVIFAERNEEMIKHKREILSKIEASKQRKLYEVEEARKKCRDLQNQINEIGCCSCKYEWKEISFWHRRWKKRMTKQVREKVETCQWCRLKTLLSSELVSVSAFEYPLPQEEYLKNAVVFELMVPKEISCLRQFLALFKYEILEEEIFGDGKNNVAIKWLDYDGLRSVSTASSHSSFKTTMVNLGSTSLPLSHTHHTSSYLDVLQNSDLAFILGNNGMNCFYSYTKKRDPIKNIREECTFQISKTAESNSYQSLQKFMISTNHSQNEVLANQNRCDVKLTLNEYVTFGSLRAGYRIQSRNLYMAISNEKLRLEHESVLALILQTIWQVGPRGRNGVRESHQSFRKENDFAMKFLEMLEKLVKSNESNYSSPLILLTAILITMKIMDLNEHYRDKCYQLLKDWRALTKTWRDKIEKDMKILDTRTIEDTKTLQNYLHMINTCAMMTYNVSDLKHITYVIKTEEDVATLLHIMSSKSFLVDETNPEFSGFIRIIGFIETNIPLNIDLGKCVSRNFNFIKRGVSRFVREKWPTAKEFKSNKLLQLSDRVFALEYENNNCFALDFLTGKFLINGSPEMEMSTQFGNNTEFKRFFQNQLNFRVVRESPGVRRTVEPYNGRHYKFILKKFWSTQFNYCSTSSSLSALYCVRNNNLVILEIPENRPQFVLVPHTYFKGIFNSHFIKNYTHWMDVDNGNIYFRRIADSDSNQDHEMVLMRCTEKGEKSAGWLLRDDNRNQFVLSKNSLGFSNITHCLSRLELAENINIYANENATQVEAHLPRHNLRFELIQGTGILKSLEYPGFQVSVLQHSMGTLIGLRSGLLLQNRSKHIIILPHGHIQTLGKQGQGVHHSCMISLDSFSQPSFYIYEFDDVLKRVVGKKSISSWLYLAALHAVTSSPLPDPFTGVTGTEMAMKLLQSARIWSDTPYDKESLRILAFIKDLSPKRKYFGKSESSHIKKEPKKVKESIEMNEWPPDISSMAAYDGFSILIDTIIQNSIRLTKIHPIHRNSVSGYFDITKPTSSDKLVLRAYLRNSDKYNSEAWLRDELIASLMQNYPDTSFLLNLRQNSDKLKLTPTLPTAYVRYLCDRLELPQSVDSFTLQKDMLLPFLYTKSPLKCQDAGRKHIKGFTLKGLFGLDFQPNWLHFYSMAISKGELAGQHEFNVLLCGLVYQGAPVEQICALHYIAAFTQSGQIQFPPVPVLSDVNDPTELNYVESQIISILKSHSEPFPIFRSWGMYTGDYRKHDDEKQAYDLQVAVDCKKIAERWKQQYWPCDRIELSTEELNALKSAKINTVHALSDVNCKIQKWFQARELKLFMDNVQIKLNEAVDLVSTFPTAEQNRNIPVFYPICGRAQGQRRALQAIQIEGMGCSELFEEAEKIYKTGRVDVVEEIQSSLLLLSRNVLQEKIMDIENAIFSNSTKTVEYQIIEKSGLAPRLSPMSLLTQIQKKNSENNIWQNYVGALGVLWATMKKLNRCIYFKEHGQTSELKREMENRGHENWSPQDHPEWLLLELELDITIRKVQVEVAQQMMEMPEGKNGVMQLNMGEGKTSVIVPMLCATLANQKSLCRVTVLSSIFKLNWGILKFSIGGLLNRRLYTFPCRRDMAIDETCANAIQAIYNECMKLQGVVLTLPEYRLSFRLLAYDRILKGETSLGLKLLRTEDWLRMHSRDILDESDELLSVKYQLVYTVGKQIKADGGDTRWTVCQEILDIVQEISPALLKGHSTAAIEYDAMTQKTTSHGFAPVRLVAPKNNEGFYKKFEELVAEKFLAKLTLQDSEHKLVTQFLLNKDLDKVSHEAVLNFLEKDAQLLNKILILAGYIHRGVLSLALSKRWRVEYGVDPKGLRKMAVPFRAKDVAAEKTEFGHPDLAITLTFLSYYYSGLSQSQMNEVFHILASKTCPQDIYNKWIHHNPNLFVPQSLRNYKSLNLKDVIQKSQLLKLLGKHKMVIDFWLSHKVFPKECMQFPEKLVMTAWDLVYERQTLPVTGFSGTNDSIVLLPLTISQQDLPHLQGTNEKMEKILLQPENDGHRGLKMGESCEDILNHMKNDGLRVLIDSGALMLELDNEQVAELWLQVDPAIEAVVYFNKDNELMVKPQSSSQEESRQKGGETTRKLPDVPFELSPFQGRLDTCGVFLDDQHTRGTDLKFPLGSKACVTIGSRMKREKLLQACMRMRRLGSEHRVAFYLSHEATDKVMTSSGGGGLTTSAILQWVKQNTKEFNDDGLVHWAIAAKNYSQRLFAEDTYHFPNWKVPYENGQNYNFDDAVLLAKQCVDQEVTALKLMYGQHSKYELLHVLITRWFDHAMDKLFQVNGAYIPAGEVLSRFFQICEDVKRRCLEHVPDKRQLSSSLMMDEEQEKELELEKEAEVEEEREVERPPKCTPAIPHLHPNVIHILTNDEEPFKVLHGIMRLSDVFKDTSFAHEVQPQSWGVEVYATRDFISVIVQQSGKSDYTDSYLRPMEYFAVKIKPEDESIQILFLSPFEVNEMYNHFTRNCSLRMYATRRFEGQDMLLNQPLLQLPSGTGVFKALGSKTREMAALLVASGSLYFESMEEQKSFARFLSLEPQPWTEEMRMMFERGEITRTGFRIPSSFSRSFTSSLRFQRDPTKLVRKILMCRHHIVSEVAHVMHLLDKTTYAPVNVQAITND